MAVVSLALAGMAPAGAGEEGLAIQMARMQTYLHKLDLSVQAGNGKLTHFYMHELEETAEGIAESVGEYDGAPVGNMVKTLLIPAIEAAEASLEANPADREAVAGIITVCNECHVSTQHGEMRIVPATSNPFNQDFQPR
jgi:hypothetical protein